MKLINWINICILIFITYIFLYLPPLRSLPNLLWLLLPFIYLYLFKYSLIVKTINLFKKEIFILLILSLYTLLRDITNIGIRRAFLYQNVSMLFVVIPFSIFIADFCYRKLKASKFISIEDYLVNIFLLTSFISSLITFYLILNPSLNYHIQIDLFRGGDFYETTKIRGFGFASLLTYSYPLIQGFAAAIILYKMSIDKSKYFLVYLIIFIFLFISVIFNARIGMVPILIMVSYFLFRPKLRFLIYAFFTILLLYFVLYLSPYANYFEDNLKWSMSFFDQTQAFITGSKTTSSNTYDILFNDMIVLPKTFFGYLFGTGEDLFYKHNSNSDIGYIRQLYFGGLIYISLLFSLIYTMGIRIYKLKRFSWFLYLFIFTIAISNIKGYFIYNQPAFRLLLLLYISLIYYSTLSKKNWKH